MEAATPLPLTHVRFLGDRLVVDGLQVMDECAVRLARESDRPGKLLEDAVAIGARVLDREQTGTDLELMRIEMEKTSREVTHELEKNSGRVIQQITDQVAQAFGPETGHVTKALQRHFSDDSSGAVQHRVKAVIEEASAKSQQEIVRQFSAADGSNPLAIFQKAVLESMSSTAAQQHAHMRAVGERLEAMRVEMTELRAERQRLEEVAASEDKGTAKGRTYEEAVVEALDGLARARGDDCEAVGDVRGEGGRKGDVVVGIEGCSGPVRGRIVFEVKNSRLSRNDAMAELDGAMRTRGAEFGVLVVPTDEKLPARTHPMREYNGDKIFVTYDPDEGSTLALEVAYGLARARVLMARAQDGGIDPTAVRGEIERAEGAMEAVRKVKSQLSNARTGIDNAQAMIETMAVAVRGHLTQIDNMLDSSGSAQ